MAENQEQQQATPEQQVALTLQDLVLVAQIIQMSSKRGAFQAEELASIGALYNKLIVFLQTTGALVPAGQETAPARPA